MLEVSFVQNHYGKESIISIQRTNGVYTIKSSNNMILCHDCQKVISTHSRYCIECGCELSYSIKSAFEEEYAKQQEEKRKEENKRLELIAQINSLTSEYAHKIWENETTENIVVILDELLFQKELSEERNALVEAIPKHFATILQQKGIDIQKLESDILQEIVCKCGEFDAVSKSQIERLRKKAKAIFISSMKKWHPECDNELGVIYNTYIRYAYGDILIPNQAFYEKINNKFSKIMGKLHAQLSQSKKVDIELYENYLASALLYGTLKKDDIFKEYIACIVLKDYYIEKNFEQFIEHFSNALSQRYHSFVEPLKSKYDEQVVQEITQYKKSPKYWQERDKYIKEYRRQQRQMPEDEALQEELNKLDYWTSNRHDSFPHISYHEKAVNLKDGKTFSLPSVYELGFVVSQTFADYLKKIGKFLGALNKSYWCTYFIDLLKLGQWEWCALDYFRDFAKAYYVDHYFSMDHFMKETETLESFIN